MVVNANSYLCACMVGEAEAKSRWFCEREGVGAAPVSFCTFAYTQHMQPRCYTGHGNGGD